MKLIIDAGTTKTASVLISGAPVNVAETAGINPVTDPHFTTAVDDLIAIYSEVKVSTIHYYGSGCINDTVNASIKEVLLRRWPHAAVYINDDLLGACIATSGHAAGITLILGTGSNIGYYDGQRVVDGVKSCGYLLGDEGSGYKIGQAIYRRYCRGIMSGELGNNFEAQYQLASERAVPELYTKANPRYYLAHFARFIHSLPREMKEEVLAEVFSPLVSNLILPMFTLYRQPIHFVGSVGFHLRDELRRILDKNDIIAGSFLKHPIEGLVKHHTYE